jgi:hypothetical protein
MIREMIEEQYIEEQYIVEAGPDDLSAAGQMLCIC